MLLAANQEGMEIQKGLPNSQMKTLDLDLTEIKTQFGTKCKCSALCTKVGALTSHKRPKQICPESFIDLD